MGKSLGKSQMQVIKFKLHLGTYLLKSHSDHLLVPLAFEILRRHRTQC